MPDPSSHSPDRPAAGSRDADPFDPHLVLVVARSPVNRVVIARIAERAGLRTLEATVEDAARLVSRHRPGTVILDGGADNHECDALAPDLMSARRMSAHDFPALILLSTRNSPPAEITYPIRLDAIVAKPITPESLQPTLVSLHARMLRDRAG